MSYDPYQPPPPGVYPPGRGSEYRNGASSLPARPPSRGSERDSYHPPSRDRDRDRDVDRYRPHESRDNGYGRNDYRGAPPYYAPPPSALPPPPSLPPPPPPGYDTYPPPSQRYEGSRLDNFRPPQGDFNFRFDKPAGVQDLPRDSQDARRDRERPGPRGNRQRDRGRDGDRDRDRDRDYDRDRRRPRGGYQGPPGRSRFLTANRPLLQQTDSVATQDFAKAEAGTTYVALEDLSDDDEAAMDISDESDGEGPTRKRARVGASETKTANDAPKWSNPDPYTALPPTEPTQKKKDVVQLIRKARVPPKEAGTLAPAEAAEFIPCDFDSDTDQESYSPTLGGETAGPAQPTGPPRGVPTGPRGATKPSQQAKDNKRGLPSDRVPTPGGASEGNLNPSRKRTHNDEIKLERPQHAKLTKATKMPAGGFIVYNWRVTPGEDPCPWLKDHSDAPNVGVWLHMEIMDFYEHVRPRQFEQRLREDLVSDLNQRIKRKFPDAEIHPFGSFMSGLYLPTGDMDLVLCSKSFLQGDRPRYDRKNALYGFRAFLQYQNLAAHDDVECIVGAKVPLVKYIDTHTALKVDISFENMNGVKAIKTFLDWKEQYPAMPILVTLVKQFLTMRGLNEPVNGGIGGFSMICLVVSMLQLMPQVQSGNLIPEHHLGEMLMHFFDLYGNKFNYVTTAIRLNPPGYVPKSQVTAFVYKNPDRLSIIDPNNRNNDISGGSSNTPAIMRAFADAYQNLQGRMAALARLRTSDRRNASILKTVFEGNYSSFRLQREYLRKLHLKKYGECSD